MPHVEDYVVDLCGLLEEVATDVGVDGNELFEKLARPYIRRKVLLYEVLDLTIGLIEIVDVEDKGPLCGICVDREMSCWVVLREQIN